MKCSTLVRQAWQCTSDQDATAFAGTLAKAFLDTRALRGVTHIGANDEGFLQRNKPTSRLSPRVRVELVHLLSPHYAVQMELEVDDGRLGVFITTLHFRDGRGLDSQSWKPVSDLEDWIDPDDEDETVAHFATRVKAEAQRQHGVLLCMVGATPTDAIALARKTWPSA